MRDLERDVKTRMVSGVRWVMALNLAATPIAFATNVILGRVSAETLGYYSAIQLFTSALQTFVLFGGPQVFTRLVPQIDRSRLLGFAVSYISLVLGLLLALGATLALFVPSAGTWALERFGVPGAGFALVLSVGVVVLGFGGHFLFALLEAPRAALAQKLVIIGFFIAGVLALGPLRAALTSDPARYLWLTAAGITGVAALFCAVQIFFLARRAAWGPPRWFLPLGFWPTAMYAHLATIVRFVYDRLAPTFVLLWLDVESLGLLHAAMRYEFVVRLVPLLVASVIAPGFSKLEFAGRRDEALSQAAIAIRATLLVLVPVCLGLVAFAGDAIAVFGAHFREHRDLIRLVAVSFLAGPLVHIGSGLLAALGAFRAYLAASLIFVLVAVGLTATLVPTLGTLGGALAMSLGALIQQAALILVLRRRFGFRTPARVWAAWTCVSGACVVAIWMDPDRLVGAALFIVSGTLFLWLGRVTPREVRLLVRKTFERRGRD